MFNLFDHTVEFATNSSLDRRRELRRITGRIVNQGQSTAIVSEPRSGKTSLLLYLSALETQSELLCEGSL